MQVAYLLDFSTVFHKSCG